ncbi:metallophosphoesterase [Mollicutes bacterium LVI A0039]|nr:metallophosphoesterase [Mollicutes bacterium LVI A0039]
MIIIAIINIFLCFFLSKVINPYNRIFRVYSIISIFGFLGIYVISSILDPNMMLSVSMIMLCLYILARREYMDLFVKDIVVSCEGTKDIDIVFIADTQFDIPGSIFDEAFDNVIDLVNNTPADLLLLGGDYLNQKENIDLVIAKFKAIDQSQFKYGVYAVMGNHDYVNYENMVIEFEKLGIKCLENDYLNIEELDLSLVGVVDSWRNKPEYTILNRISDRLGSTVVLAHQPDEADLLEGEYDIMLSGHYHAGQMNFVFGIQLNALIAKYIYGLYHVGQNRLYVTSGVGGSIGRFKYAPYLRYLARPEIAYIKLRGKDEASR